MSKDFLLEQIKALVPNEYSIELYFLKIDKRNQNPYFVFKHTFKTMYAFNQKFEGAR